MVKNLTWQGQIKAPAGTLNLQSAVAVTCFQTTLPKVQKRIYFRIGILPHFISTDVTKNLQHDSVSPCSAPLSQGGKASITITDFQDDQQLLIYPQKLWSDSVPLLQTNRFKKGVPEEKKQKSDLILQGESPFFLKRIDFHFQQWIIMSLNTGGTAT